MGEPLRQATKIMVIRHAEKPLRGAPPYGVTLEGKREKESLTVRGWQRAGALVGFFAPANTSFRDPALAAPQFLYASKPIRSNGSRRSLETITPLAEKLAIRINSNFSKLAVEDMLEEVFTCAGVVLICWQQEYIPRLANYILGSKTITPQDWPNDRFDVAWIFDREPASAQYSFQQVPQTLLMGDWATPIK